LISPAPMDCRRGLAGQFAAAAHGPVPGLAERMPLTCLPSDGRAAPLLLPESIRRGGKRFGISAQLNAQRREGDQGIGDFTTLAKLAEVAGREGAAVIGINPLHMLFPAQRERRALPSVRSAVSRSHLPGCRGGRPGDGQ